VQRDSGAPLIRDRYERGVSNDRGSAAHHFVLRRARHTACTVIVSEAKQSGFGEATLDGFVALRAPRNDD
jgi:hypothetical protein